MRRVGMDRAIAIATAEYPLFLRARRNPHADPKHPREVWIAKRAAEIMKIGATRQELALLRRRST